MPTKTVSEKEIDALRERVSELENQLARQEQTVLALQENEARLQSVLNNLLDAPYWRNLRTDRYDYFSPVIEQLTGWTVEEMNQADIETLLSWVHPDDVPQVEQEIERTNALCRETGRATGTLEYRFRTKAGDYCWLGDYLTVVAGEDRQPLYRVGVVRDITEHKQTEAALREREEKHRLISEMISDVIYSDRLFPDGRSQTDWAIGAVQAITGYTLDEINALPYGFSSLANEEDLTTLMAQGPRLLAGEPITLECRITTKSGEERWLRDYIRPVQDETLAPAIRLLGAVQDITERKRAEVALRVSEARLGGIINSAMDAIIALDETQSITIFNAAAEKMFGYTTAEMLGQPLDRLMPERFCKMHREYLHAFYRSDEVVSAIERRRDIVGRRANGEEFPVEASISQIEVVGAKYYTAILRDITERKRAEAALQESEERFRLFMDNSPTIAWIMDDEGRYVYLSRTFENRFGVRLNNWRGKRELEVWPAEIVKQFWQNDQAVLAADHPMEFLEEIPNPDGSRCIWWSLKFPLKDASGQRYVAGIGLDITEQQQMEEALYLTRFSVEHAADAIYWLDEQGHIVDINETACRMLGYSREELLHLSINDIDPKYTPEVWQQGWQFLKQHQRAMIETTHRTKEGRLIPVEVMGNYIEFGDGPLSCVFVRDISERKAAEETRARLEEQLRQAQKMESIGRLAGGVAHDFNNLLTVILGYSELMQVRLPLDGRAREQLEQIRQAAKRAEGLTRQLLAFSRKQMLVPEIFDLNGLVMNLRKMLERLISEDIALITVLQPDLWSVKADPGQIEQVVMNLVVNARDAMPSGGRLTIETVNVSPDDPFIQIHPEALSGSGVRLTVTDTGHGMDQATLAQIFEPFFTTKEKGKGTGLGLSTVYGIIKQSGGEITVDSQPGKGTVFSLYLPAHEIGLTDSTTPQPEAVAQPGRETILLVEDESIVRDFVRVALRDYGYTLLEVDHGYQALALAQQEKPIDLLLTDVVMPDINGRDLAERVKALHPQIKVLFMSGYTDDEVLRHGVQMAEVEFIAKPFSPVALVTKIRTILDK